MSTTTAGDTHVSIHPAGRSKSSQRLFFFFLFFLFWFLFDCFVWNFTTRAPPTIFPYRLWIGSLTRLKGKTKTKNLFGCVTIGIVAIKLLALFCFLSFFLSRVRGAAKKPSSLNFSSPLPSWRMAYKREDIVVCRPATAKAPAPPNVLAHDLLLPSSKLLLLLLLSYNYPKNINDSLVFFFPLFDSNEISRKIKVFLFF